MNKPASEYEYKYETRTIPVSFGKCRVCGNNALLMEGRDYCMNHDCKKKVKQEEKG